MTNTLTWDIKPIQLPKVNANLIALISLIVLCTTTFMLVHPAFADDCEAERQALQAALGAQVACEIAVIAAIWTGAGLAIALPALAAAMLAVRACRTSLHNCLFPDDSASGGCDSGGCG